MNFIKKMTAVIIVATMLAVGNIGILPRDAVKDFMLSVRAEELDNPCNKQDNQEALYVDYYSSNPYTTITAEQATASSVKPTITIDKVELTLEQAHANPVQTINFVLGGEGVENKIAMIGMHPIWDTRLTAVPYNGQNYVKKGAAFSEFILGEDTDYLEQGFLTICAWASYEANESGTMFSIKFEVPSEAKAGDLYPIGIRYQNPGNTMDQFIGIDYNSEECMLMEAYTFTQGITNGYIKIKETVTSGECGADGDNLTWTLDSEGTLTISGEGKMQDMVNGQLLFQPWGNNSDSINNVIIKAGCTSVGEMAFFACNKLQSITIENQKCEIYDSEDTVSKTATIYGYSGSTAEAYAKKYGRQFVSFSDECVHIYETETISSTCTEQGYTMHTCSKCGDSYEDNRTEPLGHNEVEIVVKEAECESVGLKEIRCSVCDILIESEDIPATGHIYESKKISPTCIKQGYTLNTCKVCDESYTDKYIDAKGHSYGEWEVSKPALCTEDGVKYHVCEECGEDETEVINKKGHTAGDMTIETEAECMTVGLKTVRCIDCKTLMESEEIPAKGHSYKVKRVPPTCFDKGYTQHTCSECGDSYKDNYTDATEHTEIENVVEKAGCETKGLKEIKCSVCDDAIRTEEIGMIGHYYVDEKVSPNCVEQGYTLHTCKNCGNSYKDNFIEPTQHQYGEWLNRETVSCNESGINYRECKVCGYEDTKVLAALGHTPGKKQLNMMLLVRKTDLRLLDVLNVTPLLIQKKSQLLDIFIQRKL